MSRRSLLRAAAAGVVTLVTLVAAACGGRTLGACSTERAAGDGACDVPKAGDDSSIQEWVKRAATIAAIASWHGGPRNGRRRPGEKNVRC